MCKYRAYFCKSEKRVQKGEDGRKKTKELALQSFWRVKKVNSKKMQGLGVGKTERAV
jgi:hypothetical protein